MSNDPATEAKSSKPDDGARGCLIGCLIIAALGIIAVFPWFSNLPSRTLTFDNHYFIEIPAFLAQYLPPGYPTEIPIFQPPHKYTLPPNLQGVLISLLITSLACLFFMILYALRKTVPWIVRLTMAVIQIILLIWVFVTMVRWLLAPSS
jgi:hypothetical protein